MATELLIAFNPAASSTMKFAITCRAGFQLQAFLPQPQMLLCHPNVPAFLIFPKQNILMTPLDQNSSSDLWSFHKHHIQRGLQMLSPFFMKAQ